MELAREDVKQDADLHDIAEAVIKLSQEGPVTMANYDSIVGFMKKQGDPATEEIARIKQLGGMQ
jgi:sensor histidine kinase regulating citrate/malate metabolism